MDETLSQAARVWFCTCFTWLKDLADRGVDPNCVWVGSKDIKSIMVGHISIEIISLQNKLAAINEADIFRI